LIQDNKSTDTTREYGNGEKDGEAEPWLNKDQVELVVQLMVFAIGCILQPFMPT